MANELIAVVPYDPEWPRRFETERALLEGVLGPWLQGGIHHIGATSIPGLAAKPIIDMMAGVRDFEEARAAFDPLRELSYDIHSNLPVFEAVLADVEGERPNTRVPPVTSRSRSNSSLEARA